MTAAVLEVDSKLVGEMAEDCLNKSPLDNIKESK